MVVGIGCDLVQHDITRILNCQANQKFLSRIFSKEEIELFEVQKTIRFISGRFAAKEAVVKCLGTGMRDGISLTDIKILQTERGAPYIKLEAEVQKIAEEMGITIWHLSITHSDNNSIAFAVAENKIQI